MQLDDGARLAATGGPKLPLKHRRTHERGQSIVELALLLPVLLLMVMAALDLGRVFMGWVVLNNAARVGANYAALHADAWDTPGNASDQAAYANLVSDARADGAIALAGCDAVAVPDPAFPNGNDLGDFAEVVLDCDFAPITPIIGDVFGSNGNRFTVSARSVFPIRTGLVAGAADSTPPSCLADFSFAPAQGVVGEPVAFTDLTPPAASGWIWNFGDATGSAIQNPSNTYAAAGTYTIELRSNSNGTPCNPDYADINVVQPPPSPDPSASSSPTASPTAAPPPTPGCVVPSFIGTKMNKAQGTWAAPPANFTTTVQFDPNAPNGNWTIAFQSLVGGQPAPCNASILLSHDPTP